MWKISKYYWYKIQKQYIFCVVLREKGLTKQGRRQILNCIYMALYGYKLGHSGDGGSQFGIGYLNVLNIPTLMQNFEPTQTTKLSQVFICICSFMPDICT